MLEKLLQKLSGELEIIEAPIKNELGVFLVKLTDQLQIQVKELDPGISFYTTLEPLPIINREEAVIYLMEANFLAQGTGGSVISLDDHEKFLTLSLVLPYDMNYKTFKDELEEFANYADYWKEELIRLSTPQLG